ncbi:hypothetical protein HJC23_008478 [Cyclotella cryptica]|uniref:Uncharacterized protein n=1 Tax=Cyclotella cryptica TaxID=29204 RepID=A0ABD3QW34_9STRA|eukprot:CCRYP_001221-RA/>CCRYP_001221-RA protein AED:0.25 eAED:0.25 QI:192/1/1/1/1/0.75/4/1514/229
MAPSMISAAAFALAIFSPSTSAFAPITPQTTRGNFVSSSSLTAINEKRKSDAVATTRRGFMENIASATAAIAGVSSVWMAPSPALAYGLKKTNEKLASYGLPPLSKVPDGFSALAEIYGKGANRSPLLVTFGFPLDWVVTLPSQDVNGEDGTIQAGEYAKGDTATFFIVPGEGKVSNIHDKDKNFFKSALIAAISQKGSNIYQDFKILKTTPVTADNQNYMLVDFKYTL